MITVLGQGWVLVFHMDNDCLYATLYMNDITIMHFQFYESLRGFYMKPAGDNFLAVCIIYNDKYKQFTVEKTDNPFKFMQDVAGDSRSMPYISFGDNILQTTLSSHMIMDNGESDLAPPTRVVTNCGIIVTTADNCTYFESQGKETIVLDYQVIVHENVICIFKDGFLYELAMWYELVRFAQGSEEEFKTSSVASFEINNGRYKVIKNGVELYWDFQLEQTYQIPDIGEPQIYRTVLPKSVIDEAGGGCFQMWKIKFANQCVPKIMYGTALAIEYEDNLYLAGPIYDYMVFYIVALILIDDKQRLEDNDVQVNKIKAKHSSADLYFLDSGPIMVVGGVGIPTLDIFSDIREMFLTANGKSQGTLQMPQTANYVTWAAPNNLTFHYSGRTKNLAIDPDDDIQNVIVFNKMVFIQQRSKVVIFSFRPEPLFIHKFSKSFLKYNGYSLDVCAVDDISSNVSFRLFSGCYSMASKMHYFIMCASLHCGKRFMFNYVHEEGNWVITYSDTDISGLFSGHFQGFAPPKNTKYSHVGIWHIVAFSR